jgi:hypothetical protein
MVVYGKIPDNYCIDNVDLSILESYKPKKIKILDEDEFNFKIKNDKVNKDTNYNPLCQFYTSEECVKTIQEYSKDNNIIYDLFIKYRFDIFLKLPYKIDINDDMIHAINLQSKYDYGYYWND